MEQNLRKRCLPTAGMWNRVCETLQDTKVLFYVPQMESLGLRAPPISKGRIMTEQTQFHAVVSGTSGHVDSGKSKKAPYLTPGR